jgi:hypothetical protein
MFTVLGLLLACGALGSAAAAFVAKEESGQKIGLFMAGLLLVAAAACIVLNLWIEG